MGTNITAAASLLAVVVRIWIQLYRYVGKCKGCGVQCRVEGRLAAPAVGGQLVVATDGQAFACADLGSNPYALLGQCACGHRVRVERVTKGSKASKHKCGGICRHAKGPSCDCLCGGVNHGAGG